MLFRDFKAIPVDNKIKFAILEKAFRNRKGKTIEEFDKYFQVELLKYLSRKHGCNLCKIK